MIGVSEIHGASACLSPLRISTVLRIFQLLARTWTPSIHPDLATPLFLSKASAKSLLPSFERVEPETTPPDKSVRRGATASDPGSAAFDFLPLQFANLWNPKAPLQARMHPTCYHIRPPSKASPRLAMFPHQLTVLSRSRA